MYAQSNRFSRMAAAVVVFVIMSSAAAQGVEPATTRPAGQAGSTLVPVPPDMQKDPPPLRTRKELSGLIGKPDAQDRHRPVHVVLVAGPKDHGPGEHDYPAWQKAWQKLLAGAPRTKVTTAWEKPCMEDLESADVLVIFKHKSWPKELNDAMEAFLARGGGIVLLHFAVDCNENPRAGEEQLGLYWGPGARFRHGWLDLEFEEGRREFKERSKELKEGSKDFKEDRRQAFLRGLAGKKVRFHDETYWRLTGDPSSIEVLATGMEDEDDGQVRIPLLWNRQVGKGRVHVNILGHYNWTFNDPVFRVLVLRGIAWSAGEPVDRFNDVVMVDVKLNE